MGYVYTKSGSLCCDFCGKAGAKKIKCPFGWCQAYAFCKACEEEHHPHGAEYREKHRAAGCEASSLRFKREAEERQALLCRECHHFVHSKRNTEGELISD